MKRAARIGTVLVLALFTPIVIAAQGGQSAPPSGMSSMQGMSMPDMMKMHDTMMARMKADDDEVKALLDKMNKATGNEKVAAMAEVLTKLVEQRTAEHGQMMGMQSQMMSHMMNGMMKPAVPPK